MTGKRIGVLAAVALIVVLALALTGCQMVAQKAIEGATGVKVDKNGESVTITGKNGEQASIGSGKVPDGFPTDVPVYQGPVTMGYKQDQGGKVAYYVTLETPDPAKTVVDWYEKQLTDQGWTKKDRNDATAGSGETSIFSAEKDTRVANVAAVTANGKTNVTITVTTKSE
jgi:hypothetical protein